jgi:hypothetical protein
MTRGFKDIKRVHSGVNLSYRNITEAQDIHRVFPLGYGHMVKSLALAWLSGGPHSKMQKNPFTKIDWS